MCAKSKSFFGLRRGSTKSLTFQVIDGVQITKDRVTEVRNPRTERQRIQRVIMNTALRAYSHMQVICNHSFEGIAYGGKTQQKFIADNIRAARARLSSKGESYKYEKAFTPIGKAFIAPNAYIVSEGSLPVVPYTMGEGLQMPKAATYADMIAAVKAQPGDQITFCLLVGDNRPENTNFAYCRVILQPQDESGANLPLTTPFVEGGKINQPNLRNENADLFIFDGEGDALIVKYEGQQVHAGAAILSRLVDGKWLRSSQTMVYASPKVGFTLLDALNRSVDDIAVNDPYYLNNAGDGETNPIPVIRGISYNGAALADGATVEAGANLVINGSNLSPANVQLFNGSMEYVQASSSANAITYNLSTAGNYRLNVFGDKYLAFTVVPSGSLPTVSNVKFAGQSVAVGANVEVEKGVNTALQMTVPAGTSAGDVKGSNSGIVISNAAVSGTTWSGNVRASQNGTVTLGTTVVIAITANDGALPPSE